MCGFCGYLRLDGAPADPAPLARMAQAIWHRGPDDGAFETRGPLALANRRLAILDLRDEARLPMVRGDLVLGYNGEVYRFADHREALLRAGHTFTTEGDSEVLLALYREHGDAFVDRLDGMFAFAVWDDARQRLLLGRDPAGKKPLYYYQDERILVFGSEIKCLLLHPEVPRQARADLLPSLLTYGYVPNPDTLFAGIHQLEPGRLLVAEGARVTANARDFGTRLTIEPEPGVPTEAWCEAILTTLREAVRRRLVSDVPLGAFLSGGLDSSLIVALMAELTDQPVRTFSIGFPGEKTWNETPHAQRVAQLFATEHTAFEVAPPDVPALLEELVWHHDQPFGDSSAIPTLLLSRLARQHVTVALGGDAGDELFAGYERFRAAQLAASPKLNNGAVRLAASLAAPLAGLVGQGTGYADKARRLLETTDGLRWRWPRSYLRWVRIATPEALARLLAQPSPRAPETAFEAVYEACPADGPADRILEANYRTYLLDDLLVKSDRMSMAASIELRSPFLDPDMLRLAGRIPIDQKIREGQGKWILKQAALKMLPEDLVYRRKHGFGVPLGEWFRGDLGGFARDLLLSQRCAERGLFRPRELARLLDQHGRGRRDHSHLLWTLLTVEQWYRTYLDPARLELPASRQPQG